MVAILDVDFVDLGSILSILVDLVDLWPVDTKTGFERPCQSTLGSPIDFNGKWISDLNIGPMGQCRDLFIETQITDLWETQIKAQHWQIELYTDI